MKQIGIKNRYLPPVEASLYVGHSRSWLDKKAAAGEIAYFRLGRKVLFDMEDLDAFMAQYRVDPGKPSLAETANHHRALDGKFRRKQRRSRKVVAK